MAIIPASYFGVFLGYIIEEGKFLYYFEVGGKLKEANEAIKKANKLNSVLSSLEIFCDLFASIMLILSLRLFKKMAKKAASGVVYAKDKIDSKIELDLGISISHIILVLGYTLVTIMSILIAKRGALFSQVVYYKVLSAWFIFAAFSDNFLTA